MHKYTLEQKSKILERLIANYGDVVKTSAEIGVPERTLWRWRKEILPLPLPPLPPIRISSPADSMSLPAHADGFRQGLPTDDLQALRELKTKMLDLADYVITNDKIKQAIDDAPLGQRVSALAQLIDRIIKLAAQLPVDDDDEMELSDDVEEVDDEEDA